MPAANYLLNALLSGTIILAVGLLPWLITAGLMQLASNSLRQSLARLLGDNAYIYLTAPGVAIHELSHAFFCLVFGHKIREMKLFSPADDGTLGYVSHSYDPKNFYQRTGNFFIGTGPVWGGIFVLYLFSRILLPETMLPFSGRIGNDLTAFLDGIFSISSWTNWKFYLWLYIALTVGSHITLSKSDLKGAADGLLILCVIVMLGCLVLVWCGDLETVIAEWLKNFFLGQVALIGTIFCLLILFCLILKLIPFKRN